VIESASPYPAHFRHHRKGDIKLMISIPSVPVDYPKLTGFQHLTSRENVGTEMQN
jgi:hypothetical protein